GSGAHDAGCDRGHRWPGGAGGGRQHERGQRADAAAHPRDGAHRARDQRSDRRGAVPARRSPDRAHQARPRGQALSAAALGLRVAGDTHVGKVRPTNEDSLIVEPRMGLYAVLDGMGGASAGDVASQLARDTIRDFVLHRRMTLAPKELLEAAITAGSTAVFLAAQQQRERQGMGTTVVACLVVDADRIVIGHVGDSRAYLLRDGRLQLLTRDHTVVGELAARGVLSVEEAARHPYKNVLSRNLGGKAEVQVDLLETEIRPGDRV